MKKTTILIPCILAVASLALAVLHFSNQNPPAEPAEEEGKMLPNDWMYFQRAYPHNHIDRQAYRDAFHITQLANAEARLRGSGEWEQAGPVNIGGRITDIGLHPTDQNIIYAGTTAGGVWKSTDAGLTWEAVFDKEGSNSIGDLAIAPSDPSTVYVGTGEANGAFESGAFFGNGVFKTTDGGQTWSQIGLEESNHVGRIAVDPTNADRVFVAATGVLYGKNEERGLFRSTDGGQNWQKMLYLSDSTACIDVAINPANPNILFAATWERIRYPWQRQYGGMTSRIYRSTDGGDTWLQLTNGLPPNSPGRGRIGLAIAPSNPDVVYASLTTNPITNQFDGIFKSTDSGDSWERVDNNGIEGIFSSFGWFFGNVRVAPDNPERLWCLGVPLYQSLDGGATWWDVTQDMHVDFHALEIHPQNPNFIVAGNDGGLYISQNGGGSWTHVESMPTNMFYNAEIDYLNPTRLFGGTQDNGTLRTQNGYLDDWDRILGGDGFHVLVDPSDNNYVYAEYQYGNLFRSSDGGETMDFIFNGGQDDRTNWNTPIALDPNNPTIIYYGANLLYRSVDRGDAWAPVSQDLTKGLHPSGTLSYGTITTIAVAPSDFQTVYVGTDDGNVQVSFDFCANWKNISAGLPDRYVTEVAVHPADPKTAYVTLSGFRKTDYQPHVLKTTTGGDNWEDISGNLPEIPVNDIIVDPAFNGEVLYVGNDLGVWHTTDGGANWQPLGWNFPFTVVNDLVLHHPTRTLVAGTYGRSLLKYDVSQIVPTSMADEVSGEAGKALEVFPNPVQNLASVNFRMEKPSEVEVEIFSLNGQHVSTLVRDKFSAGWQKISWDTGALSPGTYLVRVRTREKILTAKAVKSKG